MLFSVLMSGRPWWAVIIIKRIERGGSPPPPPPGPATKCWRTNLFQSQQQYATANALFL